MFFSKSVFAQFRRNFSASSHGHGHGGSSHRPKFIVDQDEPLQGFEVPFVFFVTTGFSFLGFQYAYRPESELKQWAREEALERNRRRKNGLPVEFGENYSGQRKRERAEETEVVSKIASENTQTIQIKPFKWKSVPGQRPLRMEDDE